MARCNVDALAEARDYLHRGLLEAEKLEDDATTIMLRELLRSAEQRLSRVEQPDDLLERFGPAVRPLAMIILLGVGFIVEQILKFFGLHLFD